MNTSKPAYVYIMSRNLPSQNYSELQFCQNVKLKSPCILSKDTEIRFSHSTFQSCCLTNQQVLAASMRKFQDWEDQVSPWECWSDHLEPAKKLEYSFIGAKSLHALNHETKKTTHRIVRQLGNCIDCTFNTILFKKVPHHLQLLC